MHQSELSLLTDCKDLADSIADVFKTEFNGKI
jgi:hypothetical protein